VSVPGEAALSEVAAWAAAVLPGEAVVSEVAA
jgi:hypothetical protein